MTKKILKIALFFVLIIVFCVNYVSATDINLNLPGIDTNQIDDTQTADDINNQNIDNPDITDPNKTTDFTNMDNIDDVYDSITSTDVQTLQPSIVTSSSDSGLSITNIINILLITVGIILILLAIAIMIRLKS